MFYITCAVHLGADLLDAKLPEHHRVRPHVPGVDPVTELVPVYPHFHYVIGVNPTTLTGNVFATTPRSFPFL